MRHRRDTSAGVIVFHRSAGECRFLLVLSRLTKRPLWEFPKGGVAQGETLKDAALRELLEETGLAAQDIRVLPGFERKEDYRFSTGKSESDMVVRKEVTYFLAEAARTDVTLSADEASEFAWLTLQEAQRRIRYRARRAMLEAAAALAGCVEAGSATQSETSSRSRDARKRSGRESA
jgi:bis(5'-nucleosidyl)-tetraphosphatase